MFPNQHGESVVVVTGERRNEFGALLGYDGTEIQHCVVAPAGNSAEISEGVISADVTKMQVFAPPGTRVEEGASVLIRGELYTVDAMGFDYAVGRVPVVSRHQPRVVFTASRGEAHDHI